MASNIHPSLGSLLCMAGCVFGLTLHSGWSDPSATAGAAPPTGIPPPRASWSIDSAADEPRLTDSLTQLEPSPPPGSLLNPSPVEEPGTLALEPGQIGTLLSRGSLEVLHPEGGLMEINLTDVIHSGELRILKVTSAGSTGVITEYRGDFFATLATPAGVYAIQRSNGQTRLTDQRQLDLRVNPTDKNYRRAPLV